MLWCGGREHQCSVEGEGGEHTVIIVDDQREPEGEEFTRSRGGNAIGMDVQEEEEATCGSRQRTYRSKLKRVG